MEETSVWVKQVVQSVDNNQMDVQNVCHRMDSNQMNFQLFLINLILIQFFRAKRYRLKHWSGICGIVSSIFIQLSIN